MIDGVNVTNTGTTTYVANQLNQYTNVGGLQPSYDDNGNLSFDGAVWQYYYDRENRLIEADDGSKDIFYLYDCFNRLIARYGTGVATTRFYYDDQWRVIAEYDGNDSLVAKYVYGPEIDEPVRMTRDGTNYYYHAAALGTVAEITLSDETLVERYMYDVYGTPKMWDGSGNLLSSSAIANRLLFQGRDRDPDTGLYNFRNRYYSPSLGRFVQVDPIGVRGGFNLYTFAFNDPANRLDPHGQNPIVPILVCVIIVGVAVCTSGCKKKSPSSSPPPPPCPPIAQVPTSQRGAAWKVNCMCWCSYICNRLGVLDRSNCYQTCSDECDRGEIPSVLGPFQPPNLPPGPTRPGR